MIGFILAFILLTSGNFIFSFYNKRFEETFAITIGGIIVFLYLFYIFNILFIGYYLLLAIILGLGIYSTYRFIKADNKKEILSNYFTPGFLIYTICFIVIYIFVRHRVVLLWDELRLWGAYPKLLYYDGSLQLGVGSRMMNSMQSYEPGMALFQFFFTKTALAFKEGYLFLTYSILCLSTMLPITKRLTFKKWYLFPLFIIILLFVPLFLANSYYDYLTYYHTLYIEPALGMFFGFTIYLSTLKMDSKINKLLFYLSVLTLVLLKDTGIIFALTACLSYFFIHKKELPKHNKKELFKLLIPALLCISLFLSWKGVQKIYNTDNMYGNKISFSEITTFFTNMTEEQKEILGDFWRTSKEPIFDSNFNRFEPFINFYTVSFLIVLSMILITMFKKKKDRYPYKIATIWYCIGSAIFVLGTLALYLFSLHIVVCFPRYVSVVITGGILYVLILVVDGMLNNEKHFGMFGLYISLFFVAATPVKDPTSISELMRHYYDCLIYTEVVKENVKPEDKLLYLYASSTEEHLDGVIYDHHIYMNLIDEGYGFPVTAINGVKEVDYNDYDYIYVFIINDGDEEELSKIVNEPIKETTLYKIEDSQFVKVE